ncbi:hypothetical protein LXL04_011097 [Taraxacum kok-saghyz]
MLKQEEEEEEDDDDDDEVAIKDNQELKKKISLIHQQICNISQITGLGFYLVPPQQSACFLKGSKKLIIFLDQEHQRLLEKYEADDTLRAVNEPNEHERRLVPVCSFNFKRDWCKIAEKIESIGMDVPMCWSLDFDFKVHEKEGVGICFLQIHGIPEDRDLRTASMKHVEGAQYLQLTCELQDALLSVEVDCCLSLLDALGVFSVSVTRKHINDVSFTSSDVRTR